MHNHADHQRHPQGDYRHVNLSFLIAVAANLLFTLVEGVYALLVNSASLLADAGHNLSDVLG
ncbi:MAG: cation transporter, partial [Pseudomonadales bacterium]